METQFSSPEPQRLDPSAGTLPAPLRYDGLDEVASRIDAAPRRLWLLDYDGTLTPIVSKPEDAQIDEAAKAALLDLCGKPGDTVAIVSGRSIAQLLGFIPEAPQRNIVLCGLHGGEMTEFPSGKILLAPDPAFKPRIKDFETEVRYRLTAEGLDGQGLGLEEKGFALVLHYRNAPTSIGQRAVEIFEAAASGLGLIGDFELRQAKMALELLPASFSKGAAARSLIQRETLALGAAPHVIAIGDDLTDEHAFAETQAMVPDSTTICVGAPGRPTLASHRLEDPATVQMLLKRLAGT